MMMRGKKLYKSNTLKGTLLYPDCFARGIGNLGRQDIIWSAKEHADWKIIFFDKEISLYDDVLDFSIDESDIVLISLPFESTYLSLLKMLKRYNLLRNSNRPLLIAGGMSMINPYPLSLFIDAFVIGSGTTIIHEIMRIIKTETTHADALDKIAQLSGVFTNSHKDKRIYAINNNKNHIYYSHWTSDQSCYEFERYFSIMTSMGCNGTCPYCVVGNIQGDEKHHAINYPYELIDSVLNEELPHHDHQVVKLFFSSGVPNICGLMRHFLNKGISFRLDSLNVRQITDELLCLLKESGQTNVTIAPETIQRLRKSINKEYFTDHLLHEKIDTIIRHKMDLTLYYICGLGGEEEKDFNTFLDHLDAGVDSSNFISQSYTDRKITTPLCFSNIHY